MYNPNLPFNVPAQVLKGTYTKINGVNVKSFTDGDVIFVSARSYGGTETTVNDRFVIQDTMNIETWYRPDITSIDGIRLLDDNSEWEILNNPEDIERRRQYLKFKVKRVAGNG